MKSAMSGSVKFIWMSLDRHVLSVCFRQIEYLKIVLGTNGDLHMQQTKLILIKNLYKNVY